MAMVGCQPIRYKILPIALSENEIPLVPMHDPSPPVQNVSAAMSTRHRRAAFGLPVSCPSHYAFFPRRCRFLSCRFDAHRALPTDKKTTTPRSAGNALSLTTKSRCTAASHRCAGHDRGVCPTQPSTHAIPAKSGDPASARPRADRTHCGSMLTVHHRMRTVGVIRRARHSGWVSAFFAGMTVQVGQTADRSPIVFAQPMP